jgi:hypothetical protein
MKTKVIGAGRRRPNYCQRVHREQAAKERAPVPQIVYPDVQSKLLDHQSRNFHFGNQRQQ